MVEQSGEAFLLVTLRCLAHTVQPLGHSCPALSRARVGSNDVLLGPCPSLPRPPPKENLLCSAGSQVLWRGPTPPARTCPAFDCASSRTGLALDRSQTRGRSPGSRAYCFSACAGSQTTQDWRAARVSRNLPCGLPLPQERVGILINPFFEAQWPRPLIPLSTLRPAPHETSRKTQGPDGFAFSFLVGLFHSLQYAGFIPALPG